MKKTILFSVCLCVLSLVQAQTYKPWDKGAFETRKYRNLFVEMGYAPKDVEAKLQEVFNDVFYGPNKVYFEVGDTMAYVSDIKNHDARTEGMSYGLMLAVQFDKKDIFDRLWRWSRKYMQHQGGNRDGYFAWSCKVDGTQNSAGAASDGELYFITALIFASNRWGNDTGINYKAEAQRILNCTMPKEVDAPAFGGFGQRQQENTTPQKQKMFLIDPDTKLITFTPTLPITCLPFMRCGQSGPTMGVPTIGWSVRRSRVSSSIRPSTKRRGSMPTCASTMAAKCKGGAVVETAAIISATTPGVSR